MSTNVNPNPGVQLTGDDKQDRDALLRSEVERLVKENIQKSQANLTPAEIAALAPKVDETPQPFKMSILGKEYEFPDQATAMKQVEATILDLQSKVANGNKPAAVSDEKQPEGFDPKHFAKKLDEDVIEGLRYALPHIPEFRNLAQDNASLRQALAVHTFRNQVPNFVPDEQNVRAINGAIQELGLNPANPNSLEAAYAYSVSRGYIKPQTQGQRPQVVTPPVVGRGSGGFDVSPDFEAMVARLDKNQLKQLIESGKFN